MGGDAVTDGLSCAELVEIVTDYLEDALDPPTRRRFEEHLAACPGCEDYLDQIRATIAAAVGLTAEDLDPVPRDRLLEAFRDWAGTGLGG